MSLPVKIIISLVICLGVGGFSGFLTADAIQNYYLALNKPSWNPPNGIFAPVWTTLYIMMGVAAGIIWHKSGNKKALTFFGIQLILNFFWSLIFFKWESPRFALIEIVFMLTAIFLTIISFKKINKTAAYLMVPYACWVSFATFLNFTIWRLN
jgi:translocator protein